MKKTINLLLGLVFLFSFMACEKDPCESTQCQNGGNCINGSCLCAEGWTGTTCGTHTAPKKITITKIEVAFPLNNQSGTYWDDDFAPDLYIKLLQNNSLYWQSPYGNNNSTGLTYISPSPYVEITDIHAEMMLRLMDEDDDFDSNDPDDFMGGVSFSSWNDYPAVKELSASYNVTFKLHLTYTW